MRGKVVEVIRDKEGTPLLQLTLYRRQVFRRFHELTLYYMKLMPQLPDPDEDPELVAWQERHWGQPDPEYIPNRAAGFASQLAHRCRRWIQKDERR